MRLLALLFAGVVTAVSDRLAVAEARAPRLGLADDLSFLDSRANARQDAFAAARRAGARMVRVTVDWSRVAPAGSVKPAGFDASDPEAAQYSWGSVEDAVRDARARGLTVVLTVVRAPRWAEGAGRPAGAAAGSWKPDSGELESFVRAAARRFSGFFPDPKRPGDGLTGPGASLPHVRYWQIWTEPNGGSTLRGGDPVEQYRALLNASARALAAVDTDNRTVAGGTSARKGRGVAPLAFWRRLLCVSRAGRRTACPSSARFDVLAHEPVSGRRPTAHLGRDELGVAALGRLRRLLERAERLRTVRGARRKPLWLTRLAWDTPPLAPHGVRPATQARYLVESLYLADRAGAAVAVWDGLQDRGSYLAGFPDIRSGLYFNSMSDIRHDPAKPSLGAYRFPFLVKTTRRHSSAWGLAPHAGRLAIQRAQRPALAHPAPGAGPRLA